MPTTKKVYWPPAASGHTARLDSAASSHTERGELIDNTRFNSWGVEVGILFNQAYLKGMKAVLNRISDF